MSDFETWLWNGDSAEDTAKTTETNTFQPMSVEAQTMVEDFNTWLWAETADAAETVRIAQLNDKIAVLGDWLDQASQWETETDFHNPTSLINRKRAEYQALVLQLDAMEAGR